MPAAELEILQEKQQEIASKQCAELIVKKYHRKPSIGTSIHARTPDLDDPYDVFFFDHLFMEKCHIAYNSSDANWMHVLEDFIFYTR